jgi:hypothetical protein
MDRRGAILKVYPYPDHQDAWQSPPVSTFLDMVLSQGGKIMIVLRSREIFL